MKPVLLEFATGIEVKTGWVQNYSYVVPSTVSSMAIDGYTATNNYACIYSACAYGDTFYVTGLGGSGSKLWVWTKADGTIIDRADSNLNVTNLKLVAPKEAAYLLVNVDYRNDYSLLKGDTASDAVGLAKNGLAPYNATNLMTIWSKRSYTTGGITFDWIGPSTCHIHGTTTQATAVGCVIWGSSAGFPPYVQTGKRYVARKSTSREDIWFRIRSYSDQGTIIRERMVPNSYAEIVVPENTANLNILIAVNLGASGVNIDETVSFEFLSEWPTSFETDRLAFDNRYNIIAPLVGSYGTSSGGCTFAWSGTECTISGNITSSDGMSYISLVSREDIRLPYMLEPGSTVFVEETISPAFIGARFYDENNTAIGANIYAGVSGDTITVPINAKRVWLYVGVAQTSGYDGTTFTCRPNLYRKNGPIIPPPRVSGTYNLRCTVSNGVPTYSWVSV